GADVEAVGVGSDMGIVTDARVGIGSPGRVRTAGGAAVVRCARCAIVLHRKVVKAPRSGRVGRLAYRDVKPVWSGQPPGVRPWGDDLQRQDDMEPSLRGRVVVAAGVGELWPPDPGGAIDGGGVAVEGVQVNRADY